MTTEAVARIVIRGGSEATRVMNGVSKSTTAAARASVQAEKAKEKAAQQSARVQQAEARRAARTAEQEAKRAAQAVAAAKKSEESDAVRVAKVKEREAKRAADAAIREAKRADKEMERLQRDETARWRQVARESAKFRAEADRSAQDSVDRRRSRVGMMTTAAASVAAGGASAISTARGIAGIGSAEDRLRTANDFSDRLIRTAGQAGVSDARTAEVQAKILAASKNTGIDASSLLGGIELGQAQFNDFNGFADQIEHLAKVSRASGADVESLVGAVGFAKQAFGVDMEKALDIMIAGASKGSIELKNFARDFAPTMGLFAQATGLTGEEGFRQLVGTSQAVGTLGKTSAESSTLVERFIQQVYSDPEKVAKLKRIGIKVKGATPEEIIDQMSTNRKFAKDKVRHDIFGADILGQQAITALISARNRVAEGRSEVDIGTMANVDTAVGAQKTDEIFAKLQATGGFKLSQQAADAQAATIKSMEHLNKQVIEVNKAGNYLEGKFQSLALWSGAITAMGVTAAGATMLQRLAGVGGAAAPAAGGMAGSFAADGAGASFGARAASALATAAANPFVAIGTSLGIAAATAYAAYLADKSMGATNVISGWENDDHTMDVKDLSSARGSARGNADRIERTVALAGGGDSAARELKETNRTLKEILARTLPPSRLPAVADARAPR